MNPTLILLTTLLLAPLGALHAKDEVANTPTMKTRSPFFCLSFFCLLITTLHAADAPSLQTPQHLGPPRADQAVTNRAFTGIPSMAVAPKGRLWATWYAGVTPGEDVNNYVVLSTSSDGGAAWTEVLTVDPDSGGPVRTFDPELWVSPDGRLFFFWAQMEKGRRDAELGVWCIETSEPDAAQPAWSKPRRIGDGVMMCKPLALSSGEWVLPISRWREHDESAQMIVSTDAGKTWTRRGGCNVPLADRQFDEHMFVERKDGSLWLLARTKYGIGESVSTDRGKTWPELKPSGILHTPSRFFIRRLASGNLLLVKHGPLDTRTSRSHLTAYLSKDDGNTWTGGLMLDERLGVSYPDGQQTPDGLIRVIYDYNRKSDRNILMAAFREEDVAAGKDVSGSVGLRQLVSKATGGQEKPKPSTAPVHTNADGKALRTNQPGTLTLASVKSQPLVPGAKLFTDRTYIAAELPAALKNAQFLPIAMNGQKTLKCERPGTVFFLTPALDRNRDTTAQPLMDQGFEKVAKPEVPLFNPASTANFTTLFQKDCAAGETILIGKWAVPVFFPSIMDARAALPASEITPNKLTPEETQRFRAAAAYSRSAHGVSVLVMRRGEIVFEDYAPGWQDKPHELASGTKSFFGVMAVCAAQDGLLMLDEKVSDTLTEWKTDPRKSQVTIRQLLSLSSGIDGGDNGAPPMYRRAIVVAEATAEPGTQFSYGPIPFQCFGELMRRKLEPRNESVEAYLKRRILDPIGLKAGSWAKDREGNLRMPSGASLTAREWVKFGEFIRLGGKWQGKELIPEALLKECFKPASAKPNYGLTFWLIGRGSEGTEAGDGVQLPAKARRVIEERMLLGFQPPKDTVAAMGKGKQRCYVIPSQELVIIRLGDSVGQEFSDTVFLSKLLGPAPGTAKEPESK